MPILCFDDFELDELRFELRRAGSVLAIRPKVLDLLVFLVRNRHRVVTKSEIFDAVWPGVAVADGSLSQAVSVLRKLLDDPPDAQRRIRTVRGRGFQFVGGVQSTERRAAFAVESGARSEAAARERSLDATSVSLELESEASKDEAQEPNVRPELSLVFEPRNARRAQRRCRFARAR